MPTEDEIRRDLYSSIADMCKNCISYKPKTKQQCKVYQLLLKNMAADMVRNEKCFIGDDGKCKGYKRKEER